jgi:alpha-glucan phosphorylase-like protein
MEIALRSEIPTYAGGLGVLAGDTIRSAADLELPLVAVSLVSRAGYFRQEIDSRGRQVEHAATWVPRDWAQPLDAKIAVTIEGRLVWIGAWLYVLEGTMGGREPVLLLDTDLDENHPDDREITHYLYGGDDAYRFKQEIVLGIGGVRLLQALGFRILQYHMNEGHSALLGSSCCGATAMRPMKCAPANRLTTCRGCATSATSPPIPRSRPATTVFPTTWCSACSAPPPIWRRSSASRARTSST